MLLGLILDYVSGEEAAAPAPARAYLYGLGLGCSLVLQAALAALYLFATRRVALKMQTALQALLYRKVVSLSSEAAAVTSPAQVLEQFSTDTDVFAGVRGRDGPQLVVVLYVLSLLGWFFWFFFQSRCKTITADMVFLGTGSGHLVL